MTQQEALPWTEEKLGHSMVKAKLLTEVQLKTAFDYQKSLGGTLREVILRLGFVQPAVLSRFLSEAQTVPQAPAQAPEESQGAPGALRGGGKRGGSWKPPIPEGETGEGPSTAPQAETDDGSFELLLEDRTLDHVLRVLIRLLIKKGVILKEELEEIAGASGGLDLNR